MAVLTGKRRVWLTGATSGIGLALARRLLAEGHRVAISARRREALEELAEGHDNALVVPLDVTDRESVREAGRHIDEAFGGLELVIHNAGTCEYLDAEHFDIDLVERVFAANFHGAIRVVDTALPLLRKSRDNDGNQPLLAAVSSSAAYLALPRAEAYGASKAALSYFLESLRLDLASERIDVSIVHPGFVKTPLTERNDFPMPMRVSAEFAAEAILKGLEKRALDIHFPKRFTLILRLLGILPPTLRRHLGSAMTRKNDNN